MTSLKENIVKTAAESNNNLIYFPLSYLRIF